MPRRTMLELFGIGAFALLATKHIKLNIWSHEAAQMYLKAGQTFEESEAEYVAQIQYLVGLLQKHKVPFTEFDMIALNFHNE